MPVLGIIGVAVVIAAVIVLGLFAPRVFAAAPPADPKAPTQAPAPVAPAAPLTRAQLEQRLRKLAETPAPTDVHPAAMCYEVAAPPDTADYVCPKDGTRTHYSKNAAVAMQINALPQLEEMASHLPGVSAEIDASEFCRKCSPKTERSPSPILIVKLADGSVKRTEGVSGQDLVLLREFLGGQIKHAAGFGEETPLKDSLPRIRELLGIPAPDAGTKRSP